MVGRRMGVGRRVKMTVEEACGAVGLRNNELSLGPHVPAFTMHHGSKNFAWFHSHSLTCLDQELRVKSQDDERVQSTGTFYC